MPYPYPELTSLLQFKCTPAQYLSVITRFIREDGIVKDELLVDQEYQSLLPTFTYARCPICGYALQGRADIYNVLSGWGAGPELDQILFPFGYRVLSLRERLDYTVPPDYPPRIIESDVFNGTQKFAHCEHFLGVHKFLNLNGDAPPFYYYTNYGEVPYVNRWMLDSNTPGHAVLFAVPICKIENGAFIPSYTIFSLTYFAQDRDALLEEWRENQKRAMSEDHEYYSGLIGATYFLTERHLVHDLVYYGDAGKLGFLDFTRPHLPLVIGKGTILSQIFRHIEGRSYFEWENGRIKGYHLGEELK